MSTLAERAAQLSPKAREVLARELVRVGTVFPAGHTMAEPVAVVGIGCRLPGNVSGPQRFWEFLTNAEDAITQVPQDRWDADAFYDPDPLVSGRMTTKWGGFLSDVAGFDADFFGITPREATAMDPQHRLLLEVSWEALEHAGIVPDSLRGTRTGLVMGLSSWDYSVISLERRAEIDAYLSTGNVHSAAVGRIAYLLGLHGPAMAVDTACSSSLVALHLACQSLRLRESNLALAGGVNLSLSPMTSIALSKLSALSPTGRCKSFDAAADGFVRSEGCGVVVLKRLADALRDNDRVLAVVRGSAVNQDGRSNGLTAPNALAQRDVIADALRAGDVAADSVNFIEAHGTGTVLGDPIEFESLAHIYGRGDAPCALGAVKTNLGHLEAAAGIAGFIKTVLAVHHGQVPANLHFNRWNPAIDADATRFFVPTEAASWPSENGPRRAAISSFGVSGTNAHVVVEQGLVVGSSVVSGGSGVSSLVVSGKSVARVGLLASVVADWLESPAGELVGLADVAHTLSHHRSRFARFGAVCARDRDGAVAGLRALAGGVPGLGVVLPHEGVCGSGRVFVYSGQGSQWAGMGSRLLAEEPLFGSAVDDLEPVFVEQVGFSLRGVLASSEPVVGIERIQPVLVGLQMALTALWRGYGVEPDAVIGHSMGEVTAAVVAGGLSVAEGLRVIATRSRLMARLSGQGAMALVELDAQATQELIAGYPGVGLAVYASPRQSVVAGSPEQVDAVIAAVSGGNRLARRVEVDVASHHRIIDPVLGELRVALGDLAPRPPVVPVFSTTLSDGSAPVFDGDYWAANLRQPVRFHQAIAAAAQQHCTFIEISPHPLLTHAITETVDTVPRSERVMVTSAMNRDDDSTVFFHTQLAAAGVEPAADGRLVDAPSTPWQHSSFWIADRSATWGADDTHPLLGIGTEIPSGRDHVWQADVGTDVCPWLADHRVYGQPVMPGTGYAEIVLAAGAEALGLPAADLTVKRLEIEQMLALDRHTRITTQLTRGADDDIRVEVYSRSAQGDWRRHAAARIETTTDRVRPAGMPGVEADGTAVAPADLYGALRRSGQHHGPAFAALNRVVRLAGGGSVTEIVLPEEASEYPGCQVHPVMLDAALQSLVAAMPDSAIGEAAEATYLPVSFETIRLFGKVGRYARCYAELIGTGNGAPGALGRITLTSDDGTPTAEITGIYARRVERRTVPLPLEQKVFETAWEELPGPSDISRTSHEAAGSWLVLSDDRDSAGDAEDFAARWRSSSRRVVTANLTDEPAVLESFAETAADPDHPPAGVIICIGHDPLDSTDPHAALKRSRDSIWYVSSAVRAIVGGWHGRSPRLWLVTRQGLATDDGPGDPAIAALKGLVRVLAYEHPELNTTLVDLDSESGAAEAIETEAAAGSSDDVIAWRGKRRFSERLVRASLGEGERALVIRAEGSYIVTGGLGGIGMVVAEWLVDRGARRVVLNSRSAPGEEQRETLSRLEERAEIAVVTGDIASAGVAEQLVAAAEATGLALRGIVHGAAVLDDSLLGAMSKESLDRVWAPKAEGALRLHRASAAAELDWWMVFSSMASLLGSPGQAAYACASAWVDALVSWRAAKGLPAAAINWGPWSEVGFAQSLTGTVLDPISPPEGIEALEALLACGRKRTGVARLRADRVIAAFPEIRGLGYFAQLVEEFDLVDGAGDWAGPEALWDCDPAEARELVSERLRMRVAAIMGYADQSAVDPAVPLVEFGMDSLMAVRIRNTARADFGAEPPVALLLEGASLRDITADLIRQLGFATHDSDDRTSEIRDRAQQRAAARQGAALRRKRGQRV